jgi:hypothetical protein
MVVSLEQSDEDDSAVSTQSNAYLNPNGCRRFTQALPVLAYSRSRPRFSKRVRDLTLLRQYREFIQVTAKLFQEQRDGAVSKRALSEIIVS